jgi:predicted Zn finger-like uncharacterized protein
MLTRCPYCQTRFRVTPTQLKLRMGKVRCGVCDEVFDALDALSDEMPPAEPAITETLPSVVEFSSVAETHPPPVESTLQDLPDYAADFSVAELTAANPLPPEAGAAAIPETVAETAYASAAETADIPEKWLSAEADSAPRRQWPWLVGIVGLVLLACGHLLYIFRTDLAVHAPAMRPILSEACAFLGCTVPRPLRPDLTSIETSELTPEDDHLLLTVLLKNRAPFVLDYPHLELTLTGSRDEALIRKVLTPQEYLPVGRDPAQGFPARRTVDIQLQLAATGVAPLGYRLYLFYP